MDQAKRSGITLIELIIVITILAILGTLSYIYVIGSYANSRDALRLNNMSNVKKVFSIERVKRGSYPEPDNAKDIYLDGKLILKQGVISDDLRERLEIGNTLKDPKYETDMSYSVSATQESYEIGTVLENNGAGTPSGFIIPQTYAAEYKSSYLNGNYNGKYYRSFSGGTTLIYALPSLTMNDTGTGDLSLYVNQATNKFSINGYGTIPESFSGITTEQTKINYTPRLLFSGNKCGVETDQEIVNFIALTRDAYNKEPFTYLHSYADIFEDYEYLKDNLIDFEKLKVLGVKINEGLQCNITNFKTTDIFPTACGTENGIFDLIDDGFDIANSCIYTFEGDQYGNATIKEGVGNLGTNGLELVSTYGYNYKSRFKYRFFSYVPFKLKFDYKGNFTNSNQNLAFKIDGLRYELFDINTPGIDNFQTYETVALGPGIHEMTWEIMNANIILDNIVFSCTNGEANCGWEDGTFENGDTPPHEIFTFGGVTSSSWMHVTGSGNVSGANNTYAIKNPLIDWYAGQNGISTELTYNKSFSQSQKLLFDIKSELVSSSYLRFYINDIEYDRRTSSSETNNNFFTFETPLLPPGSYNFKWVLHKYYWNQADMTLDNIELICSGGGGNCGWDEESLEPGSQNPADIFIFTGALQTPWLQVTGSENVNGAGDTYAIKNPYLPGSGYNTTPTYLILNKTFLQASKIQFDMKTLFGNDSSFGFYINDVLYEHGTSSSPYQNNYQTFTSPLLPAGDYEFKWLINRRHSGDAYIWLDNISYPCMGGGSGCGYSELLDQGDQIPTNIVTFGGDMIMPWIHVTGTGNVNGPSNGYALKNPTLPYGSNGGTNASIEFTKTLSQPQKFSFDIKALLSNYDCRFDFYINGARYLSATDDGYYEGSGYQVSNYDQNYRTFTTPLLPAGDYKFKWVVKRVIGGNAYIWLDNLNFSCIGGGINCGWEDEKFEMGDTNPSSIFTFTGSINHPWLQLYEAGTEGSYAVTHPSFTTSYGNYYMIKEYTVTAGQSVSFDYMANIWYGAAGEFSIDGDTKLSINQSTPNNSTWKTFTSDPLSAGIHTMIWRSYGSTHGSIRFFLDNIHIN